MRPAASLRPATATNVPVLDDDAAHRRVWPSITQPPPRKGERGAHMRQVAIINHSQTTPAKAGAHLSTVPAAARWGPAFAGMGERKALSPQQSPSAAIRPTNSPKSLASRKLR